MIRSRLAVCAESVIIDRFTNGVSLINVIEDMSAVGFPIAIDRMAVLFVLERDESDEESLSASMHVDFRPTDPGGEDASVVIPVELDFQGKLRVRSVQQIEGLPLPGPGVLGLKLTGSSNELLGSWSIPVSRTGPSSRQKDLNFSS